MGGVKAWSEFGSDWRIMFALFSSPPPPPTTTTTTTHAHTCTHMSHESCALAHTLVLFDLHGATICPSANEFASPHHPSCKWQHDWVLQDCVVNASHLTLLKTTACLFICFSGGIDFDLLVCSHKHGLHANPTSAKVHSVLIVLPPTGQHRRQNSICISLGAFYRRWWS